MSDNVQQLRPTAQATSAFVGAAHEAVKRLTMQEGLRRGKGIEADFLIDDARRIIVSAESTLAAAYAVLRLHGALE